MKVYKCDACGKEITDPYKVYMREFYVGLGMKNSLLVPSKNHVFKRVRICGDCYKSLQSIGNKKIKVRGES